MMALSGGVPSGALFKDGSPAATYLFISNRAPGNAKALPMPREARRKIRGFVNRAGPIFHMK
jgi:hypothetical protein